ncbi:MAG TPA: hypothetical protein VJC05_02230, partial [Candidatus Andersenbacteria bacterium]|nr:hypothetical protein [Candidatus Andersenbacteria bacterium]
PATRREELAHAVGFAHTVDMAQSFGSPAELTGEGTGDLTESGGEVAGATTAANGTVAGIQDEGLTPAKVSGNPGPNHTQGFYGRLFSHIVNDPKLREAASLPPTGFSGQARPPQNS